MEFISVLDVNQGKQLAVAGKFLHFDEDSAKVLIVADKENIQTDIDFNEIFWDHLKIVIRNTPPVESEIDEMIVESRDTMIIKYKSGLSQSYRSGDQFETTIFSGSKTRLGYNFASTSGTTMKLVGKFQHFSEYGVVIVVDSKMSIARTLAMVAMVAIVGVLIHTAIKGKPESVFETANMAPQGALVPIDAKIHTTTNERNGVITTEINNNGVVTPVYDLKNRFSYFNYLKFVFSRYDSFDEYNKAQIIKKLGESSTSLTTVDEYNKAQIMQKVGDSSSVISKGTEFSLYGMFARNFNYAKSVIGYTFTTIYDFFTPSLSSTMQKTDVKSRQMYLDPPPTTRYKNKDFEEFLIKANHKEQTRKIGVTPLIPRGRIGGGGQLMHGISFNPKFPFWKNLITQKPVCDISTATRACHLLETKRRHVSRSHSRKSMK
jgi:hypothetical protein